MSRDERSAGVVLFVPSTGVDLHRYLLLDYGRYWDLPKGHVEDGETDESAALRELGEETGITDAVLIPPFRQELNYFFRAKRHLVRKTVVFFLARTTTETVRLSHEHVGCALLPYDEALKRLTYPNAKKLLTEAEQFLNRHPETAESD